MARIPRRAHSVSGPPSMHSMLKDVACCCNIVKMHQFYLSVMELRRNPQRKCKKEDLPITTASGDLDGELPLSDGHESCDNQHRLEPPQKIRRIQHRRATSRQRVSRNTIEPFRFFDLPREVRDHVYSFLVLRRGVRRTAMIEAKPILKEQKKRINAQRTRERLNEKRILSGKRPIVPREIISEPQVHLTILQASKLLHYEASDMLYQQNWFALSLDNLPSTTIETPSGWNFGRITKVQLELQLKDAQRMNSYIDWVNLFASFPALRMLRIIPTFHPRYIDWAQAELDSWTTAHFIFKAFFRELLVSIPEHIRLKLGPSPDPSEDMQLEGKAPVAPSILWSMYAELGMRRHDDGTYLPVGEVVG